MDPNPEANVGVGVDVDVTTRTNCKEAVLGLFPDICPDFLEVICQESAYQSDAAIDKILVQSEKGEQYPKRPRANLLKRKRSSSGEDSSMDEAKKFDNEFRRAAQKHPTYLKVSNTLLQQDFPLVYSKEIYSTLEKNGNCLYPTYMALAKIMEEANNQNPPIQLKRQASRRLPHYKDDRLDETIQSCVSTTEREALHEFRAARASHAAKLRKFEAEKRQAQEEIDNFNQAKTEGLLEACECCYEECPLNRMVHCDGENPHYFCKTCARSMAEVQIGLSKYHLGCMSMDSCEAGFSRDQRSQFLDQNSIVALDRIEQEAVLRMAGIENLESCPFCPYAAEYPPISINREFSCQYPECELVSCRLCRQETHIPKTCEEAARENGSSARRIIEEAMSAALIRKCNKCSTPFVKEHGCNKMTCTRNGCMNVQCYICSKSCDYRHFDDQNRGGKKGNCPLFDPDIDKRHENEVRAAEEQARKQVVEENPEVEMELLQFKMSEKVKNDGKQPNQPYPRALPPGMRPQAHMAQAAPGVRERARQFVMPGDGLVQRAAGLFDHFRGPYMGDQNLQNYMMHGINFDPWQNHGSLLGPHMADPHAYNPPPIQPPPAFQNALSVQPGPEQNAQDFWGAMLALPDHSQQRAQQLQPAQQWAAQQDQQRMEEHRQQQRNTYHRRSEEALRQQDDNRQEMEFQRQLDRLIEDHHRFDALPPIRQPRPGSVVPAALPGQIAQPPGLQLALKSFKNPERRPFGRTASAPEPHGSTRAMAPFVVPVAVDPPRQGASRNVATPPARRTAPPEVIDLLDDDDDLEEMTIPDDIDDNDDGYDDGELQILDGPVPGWY